VICALLRDFRKHGEKAIAEVRRTQPGVYLKVIALVLPREHHKVEHTNSLSSLSDEELAAMVEDLKTRHASQSDQVLRFHSVERSLRTLQGCTVYQGHGRFVAEKKVAVNGSF
jgi:hypothetical protein